MSCFGGHSQCESSRPLSMFASTVFLDVLKMPCMLLHDTFEEISDWPEYVEVIINSGLIDSCVVINMRGRILAQSEDEFSLSKEEPALLIDALSYPHASRYKTLSISEQLYDVIINDGKHGIMLKNGVRYATVCRTSKVLIVGLHKVDTSTDDASAVIMNLGDFLITKGM